MTKGWYVDIIRGQRVALLAGPFATRAEAEVVKPAALALAYDLDPWTWFDIHGVCHRQADRLGKLNQRLGLTIALTPQ